MSTNKPCFLGIDVGTSSVRAALVSQDGQVIGNAVGPIEVYRDEKDVRVYEMCGENIWKALCAATRAVVQRPGIFPEDIRGIGVAGTCSLVVVDRDGAPLSVSVSPRPPALNPNEIRNVVLWCDHRGEAEARRVNKLNSSELDVLGGSMDLELDIPKIMHLKEHMKLEDWKRATLWCLPDYFSHRMSSSSFGAAPSSTPGPYYPRPCTSYSPHSGWSASFLSSVGLEDFARYASDGGVLFPGNPLERGLLADAAREMGLVAGTSVGAGVVDCYAGYFATIAAPASDQERNSGIRIDECAHRVGAITGTSTCFVVQNKQAVGVKGVWGPLKDTLFVGWYMGTGGQSATGALLSHVITTHPAYRLLPGDKDPFNAVEEQIASLMRRKGLQRVDVSGDVMIYPDFHGNRAPLADAEMRGMWTGLTLDTSLDDLAMKYQATLEALALQFRHIFEEMNAAGHAIAQVHACGGQGRNAALMQLLADACGISVVLPPQEDFGLEVARGSAILGRCAYELSPVASGAGGKEEGRDTLWQCMTSMTRAGTVLRPTSDKRMRCILDAKYKIFREMAESQRRWRSMVIEAQSALLNG